MFGKGGSSKTGGSDLQTVVGADTVIQGTISSKGSMRIDGKVEGGITDADAVVIGEHGEVHGDIAARSVVVGGRVTGNVSASSIEVLTDAQMHGDLKTAALAIAEGATFEGNCIMTKEKQVIEMDLASRAKK
ncbi:MAG: hypothetical protein A2636_06495 [Elusimicrobia bacterium RIFCSPHIGHO2_01_FULL_64_10]|nr:MAG: hypothetical protein A2636_06495 [Elusimicrobia bacterium RIFCSPHIGHO2_01_FULL_64_10]